MNLTGLRLKLTVITNWLALRFESYFCWFALAILLLLFVLDYITFSGLVLWTLTWIFLSRVAKALGCFNKQLNDLNEKFSVNQRKISKSIKDHNEYVTDALLSQKRFFDSIVKPKKGDN